ncbi:hypothetical protein [Bifidobacterium choloepi]|uniref:ABC transporter permease n=1 Tax=Bifidobacterium choloepi TaxID=2614131 RepID=A0A6I5NGX0_9BIFI|nr:hypothetical protein [Bifidobacterium choloepi]NEG70494.1 hypothetical protein [Bifidobacterium choloepi]
MKWMRTLESVALAAITDAVIMGIVVGVAHICDFRLDDTGVVGSLVFGAIGFSIIFYQWLSTKHP